MPESGEPLFTPDDVEGALALQWLEDGQCPGGCGQRLAESMLPTAEGAYSARKFVCHACAERQKTEADLRDSPSEPGIHIVIERT